MNNTGIHPHDSNSHMAPKSKCKKAKAQPAVAAPKPQGGKTKRTPTGTFDGAAGKDTVLDDVSLSTA